MGIYMLAVGPLAFIFHEMEKIKKNVLSTEYSKNSSHNGLY